MTDQIPEWMIKHEEADNARFEQITKALASLATKDDLKGLATEKSLRGVIHWQRNMLAAKQMLEKGGQIIGKAGKWGYRATIVLATLLGALAVITGAWKSVLIWLISK